MESVVAHLTSVPVTRQTSPSQQGDTETETSKCVFVSLEFIYDAICTYKFIFCHLLAGSSPTISDHLFSLSPTPEPAPVKRVASSPTHHPQPSNPGNMV